MESKQLYEEKPIMISKKLAKTKNKKLNFF